jgi:purine-binding chemotaxis protein CheW
MTRLTTNRWLILRLGDQRYAVSIAVVRELVPEQSLNLARVPQTVRSCVGVAALRDEVLPIYDLRTLFGLASLREETNELTEMLNSMERDHLRWLEELESSVREKRQFSLQLDPHQCEFGKWYDSLIQDNQKLFNFCNGDLTLTDVVRQFDIHHKQIHGVGTRVSELVAAGLADQALSTIETCRNADLQSMRGLFSRTRTMLTKLRAGVVLICSLDANPIGMLVDGVDRVAVFEERDIQVVDQFAGPNQLLRGVTTSVDDQRTLQVLNPAEIIRRLSSKSCAPIIAPDVPVSVPTLVCT